MSRRGKGTGRRRPVPDALNGNHVCSLKALRSFDHLKFNCRTFLEIAITVSLDGGIMDEDVFTLVALNEAVTFGRIEPLYGPSFTIVGHFYFYSFRFDTVCLPASG